MEDISANRIFFSSQFPTLFSTQIAFIITIVSPRKAFFGYKKEINWTNPTTSIFLITVSDGFLSSNCFYHYRSPKKLWLQKLLNKDQLDRSHNLDFIRIFFSSQLPLLFSAQIAFIIIIVSSKKAF